MLVEGYEREYTIAQILRSPAYKGIIGMATSIRNNSRRPADAHTIRIRRVYGRCSCGDCQEAARDLDADFIFPSIPF